VTLAMLGESQWPADWAWSIAAEGNATERRKTERATCGLSPGTYLLVEQAIDKAPPGVEPQFRRWGDVARIDRRGAPADETVLEGRVGVQIQGGVTVAEALSGLSTALRIEPLPAETWATNYGRRHAYATARIRIGMGDGSPMWCALRVHLHRPLPSDGDIRQAWISVRHDGRRTRYRLQLVVSADSFARIPPPEPRVIAIDFGWRVKPNGDTRVAYSVDDVGTEREYVLPAEVRGAFSRADSLRGFSDDHFNHARATLEQWLGVAGEAAPAWMREAAEHIAQWRQHWRLVDIAERWRSELVGDLHAQVLWKEWISERKAVRLDLFAPRTEIDEWLVAHSETDATRRLCFYLEWWRKKETHLYDYATTMRAKAERRRADLYRVWAREIATRYSAVLVEDTDFRKLIRKAATEDETADHLHRIQRDASPGDLRRSIVEAAGHSAALVPAQDSTRRCHRCRYVNTAWKHPEARVQCCAGCGVEWDQDSNACRNWLASWGEGLGGDGSMGGSRAPENHAGSGDGRGRSTEAFELALKDRSQSGRQDAEIVGL